MSTRAYAPRTSPPNRRSTGTAARPTRHREGDGEGERDGKTQRLPDQPGAEPFSDQPGATQRQSMMLDDLFSDVGNDPDALASTLAAHLGSGDCRAVLLVGRTHKGQGFRVQMRAENRTLDHKHRLSSTGPGVARATAPVADIVRALTAAGLEADASSEAEEDAGSYLLYRVLADLPDGPLTPSIGLLRAPAPANEAAVRKGVKAAASAMASHLTPLPRAG